MAEQDTKPLSFGSVTSDSKSGSFVWKAPANYKPKPKPTQPAVKPTEPAPEKEVKPVAKDPKGMFDYSDCKQVVVKDGQSLLDVANAEHVAYEQLRYFNHLDKNNPTVKGKQVLYIPKEAVRVPLGK